MKSLLIITLLLSCLFSQGQEVEDSSEFVPPQDSIQYDDAAQQQAQAQQTLLQQQQRTARLLRQAQIDSLERPRLKDSLGVHDTTATAMFAIRCSFFDQSDSIYADPFQDLESKQETVRALRKQTSEAYRKLLGETLYRRYVEMILRESGRKLRGEWDTDIDALTLEPI